MKNVTRITPLFFLAIALILSACAPLIAQAAKDIDTRPQMTPTTAPLPSHATDNGSNAPVPADAPWKSFTSDLYGYTVSYPADWTVKVDTSAASGTGKSPEYVTFAPSAGGLPSITIYALTGMPPFAGYENCNPSLVFRGLDMCQISVPAGQIPATDLNLFHNGEQFFQIALQYEGQEARGVFDLFMRSFQFTRPVYNGPAVTVLTTYASKAFGYTVDYPAAWSVKVETPSDNAENVTFTPAAESGLVSITINAVKGTLPFSTFLACESNLVFRDLKACRVSLPGDQATAVEQLIFEKGDARFEITMHHTGGSAMEAFDNFLTSFQFFR
ncbi:MAG: hypothetical protein ACXWNC_05625 [Anaerolineales bacterium]